MISIIIPTYNEENYILQTLQQFKQHPLLKEIIVVDSNSSDKTKEIVEDFAKHSKIPTLFLESEQKGRGNQMQLGLEASSGDVIHLVHADTILPTDFQEHIHKVLKDPAIIGGAFRIQFTSPKFIYKLIALSSNFRSKYVGLYHGDAAMFVRKDILFKIGGVPQIPLMEDVELSRLLKKIGKTKQIRHKLTTSSRRIEANGILRSVYVYIRLYSLYFMGYSPSKMRDIYERMKK